MDVMEAVEEFYGGGVTPKFYYSLFIVLIPNIQNPQKF